MSFWIYKCNARRSPGHYKGDWDDVFVTDAPTDWGSVKDLPQLSQAQPGDQVIALQSDRNELVGVAVVVGRDRNRNLVLRPEQQLRIKVRPLKKRSRGVARIPALQPGPVQTLYAISDTDAKLLLRVAALSIRDEGRALASSASGTAEQSQGGAGFGRPEQNREVERAAIRFATKFYRHLGFRVDDCSTRNLGYDLDCRRGRRALHVEVKGAMGKAKQFIITRNELRTWRRDPSFVLALVTEALRAPRLQTWRAKDHPRFEFGEISFLATFKG
jgi:hypothetical protein